MNVQRKQRIKKLRFFFSILFFIFSSNMIAAPPSNAFVQNITVGISPQGVAFTPDGSKVYVANFSSNTVSVINPATNTLTNTIAIAGAGPIAFGKFIG